MLESGDMSATWQYMPTRQVFYRLYGTYSIAGTPVSVTRTYLSTVTALLQTADAPHSHIDASISLMNRPELTTAVWRTDFESNPTAIDCDGDGTFDWIKSSGSFNSGRYAAHASASAASASFAFTSTNTIRESPSGASMIVA